MKLWLKLQARYMLHKKVHLDGSTDNHIRLTLREKDVSEAMLGI